MREHHILQISVPLLFSIMVCLAGANAVAAPDRMQVTIMFAKLDANGDGFIDVDEADKHHVAHFSGSDMNSDGLLSLEEHNAGMMRMMSPMMGKRNVPAAPQRIQMAASMPHAMGSGMGPGGMDEAMREKMTAAMGSGMGTEGMDEAMREKMKAAMGADGAGGGAMQQAMGARMSKYFKVMDVDGDGALSQEEFVSGHRMHFHSLDLDGDGKVSLGEFRKGIGNMTEPPKGPNPG